MATAKASGMPPHDNERNRIELIKTKLPEYLSELEYCQEFVGEKIKMRCPFHDDTNPSFEIYGDTLNRWHCFPCDCGGDIFDLSIKLGRATDFKSALSDIEAVLDGKADLSIKPNPEHCTSQTRDAKILKDGEANKIMDAIIALNSAKSFNDPVIKDIEKDLGFGLSLLNRRLAGSMSTLGLYDGRLAYCYRTGLKVRRFRNEEGARFYWAFGKPTAVWRSDRINENVRTIVITEGETDCVVAVICGLEDDGTTLVVASPGTSFPSKCANDFAGKHVILCFDLDEPGQNAARRVAKLLSRTAASVSIVEKDWEEGQPKDLRDIYINEGVTAVTDHIESAKPWLPEEGSSTSVSDEESEDLPVLLLPGDNRTLGDFCRELGVLLATRGFYSRSSMPFASLPSLEVVGNELKRIDPHMFRSMVDPHVKTVRYRKAPDGIEQVGRSMHLDVAQAVLASPQFLAALPALDYLRPAPMPIIREDGRLELLPVGYDLASRTLTHEDVIYDRGLDVTTGRQVIEEILKEFRFLEPRSKAATIAAMLTGFCPHLLPQDAFVPCFLFDANAQGSGKTTLAQIVALSYGVVAVQPAPKEELEWRKRLLPMIMAGRGVTILDNVDHYIDSAALSMYLSSYCYSDRILGTSQEYTGKPSTLILMTGNKMTYSRDLARRVIVIDLFSEELRGEDRRYERRINLKLLKKYRKVLMAAMWALVKEWDQAGRPKCSTVNASFPDWSEIVGGIVEHNGFGDPVVRGTREDSGDIDTVDLENLAKAMTPDQSYAFKDIVALCGKHGLFERFVDDTDQLGQLSRQAKSGFGKMLKTFDKRLVKDLGYFKMRGKGHYRRYAIESLPPASQDDQAAN